MLVDTGIGRSISNLETCLDYWELEERQFRPEQQCGKPPVFCFFSLPPNRWLHRDQALKCLIFLCCCRSRCRRNVCRVYLRQSFYDDLQHPPLPKRATRRIRVSTQNQPLVPLVLLNSWTPRARRLLPPSFLLRFLSTRPVLVSTSTRQLSAHEDVSIRLRHRPLRRDQNRILIRRTSKPPPRS